MKRTATVVIAMLVLLAGVAVAPAFCQDMGQGPMGFPGQGMGGPDGGSGGRMGMSTQATQAPTPVMLVAEGVLYIACDGKVTAFDAKTLKKIGDAMYWERPKQDRQNTGARGG